MKLVRSWLDAVGLQAHAGTFEAAGITTPAALAELDVAHFEALGVRSAEERRKLFFLVQRIRKAIADRDASVLESETPPTSPEGEDDSEGSDTAENGPQGTETNRKQGSSHATAHEDAAALCGRKTPKPAAQLKHDADDEALDSLLQSDTHEENGELDEGKEADNKEDSRQDMNPSTVLRNTNLPQRKTRSSSPSLVANGSIPVAARQSPSKDSSVTSISKTGLPRKSEGDVSSVSRQRSNSNSSDSRPRRPSGVPEPTSRIRPPESRLPQPSSMRTGKQLSAIPANKTAPMSPLVELPKTSQLVYKDSDDIGASTRRSTRGRRRSTSLEQRSFESTSDSDNGSVTSESGLPRHSTLHPRRQRSLSNHRPPRSDTQPSHGDNMTHGISRNANSRVSLSSENKAVQKSNNGARASLGHRSLGDINPRSAVATSSASVTIQGRKEDDSFKAQIQQLRQDNDADYELFGVADDRDDSEMRIRVVVRKRPMSTREIVAAGDVDVIHPLDYGSYGKILVYQPKTRVDLTKEIDTISFAFDNVFDEQSTNQQVYERCIRSLIPSLFDDESAVVSIFAYGQTGSGKTFTMLGSDFTGLNDGSSTNNLDNLGIYFMASLDIFHLLKDPEHKGYSLSLSLFEIYGGKLFDLLNERENVKCLEDNRGKVNFPGLSEHDVPDPEYLMELISIGAANRSTGTTSRNSDSSRSHAVMQIHIKKPTARGKMAEHSRLTVVDLAGSERGADTATASLSTRLEGAEINTSLLALKEVIRAMATGDAMTHIPFRGSKLTQVLKESFVGPNCRSVMIGCISPNIGNCEQTLNTLRYADRVKQRNSATGEYTGRVDEDSMSQHPQRSSNSLSRSESQTSASTAKEAYSMVESDGPLETGSHSSVSAMLDDILSSPQPKQPLSRASSLIADAGVPARSTADPLIQSHKRVMTRMLEMLKDEMDIVNLVDGDHNGFDEYIGRMSDIQEEQLSCIADVREQLLQYHSMRNAVSVEFSSEDSFEDLRD